jgi:hypothetical protein
MADRETCAGFKLNGTPCNSPFVVKGTRYCSAHQPGGREEMQRRGLMGALASRRTNGLGEEELSHLETHEDAKRRLDLIGQAVLTGRLRDGQANAAVRSVEAWLRAEGERLTVSIVEDLRRQVQDLKTQLGRKPAKVRAVSG